jgi:hypothetical protein
MIVDFLAGEAGQHSVDFNHDAGRFEEQIGLLN